MSIFQDKYLLAAMIMLSAVCVWHALVTVVQETIADRAETIVLIALGVIYVIYNVGFLIIIYLYVSIYLHYSILGSAIPHSIIVIAQSEGRSLELVSGLSWIRVLREDKCLFFNCSILHVKWAGFRKHV